MENIGTQTFVNGVNEIYRKSGYLDRYGLSLIITCIIVAAFVITMVYFRVSSNFKAVKADWINERCNPKYIPFAGTINDYSGKAALDFTAQNFTGCTQSVLREVANNAFAPINYMSNAFGMVFTAMGAAINKLKSVFSRIRNATLGISEEVSDRTLSSMTPIMKLFVIAKDTMAKSSGVATTGIYTLVGSYMTLQALIGAILELTIIFLIILAAFIVIMWIIPFTWPVAAANTAIFIAVAIPLAIMAVFLAQIMNTRPSSGIPETPSCFHPNTVISTSKGSKPISEIKPGDILYDGTTVHSVMNVARGNEELYSIYGIIVSGSHLVFEQDRGWIAVDSHPYAVLINDPIDTLYCLTTSTKTIKINGIVFCDWDDVTAHELEQITRNKPVSLEMSHKSQCNNEESIHRELESGFSGDTIIPLADGNTKKLRSVEVGDILCGGHSVIGTVKISTSSVDNVGRYFIDNNELLAGPNFTIKKSHHEQFHSSYTQFEQCNIPVLYSLVTDTHQIPIGGFCVNDYDSRLDAFMDPIDVRVIGVGKNYL